MNSVEAVKESKTVSLGRSGNNLIASFNPPVTKKKLFDITVPGFPIIQTVFNGEERVRAIIYDGNGVGQFNNNEQSNLAFKQQHDRVAQHLGRTVFPVEVVALKEHHLESKK